jgi:hypothetical protein
MLAVTLFGVAAAVCSLPASVDPNSACVQDANGWSTLDADSDVDIPISLTIVTKGEIQDAFEVVHPATAGALTDNTATDGRYILACPQVAGKKTVQFIIDRPASLTAFGAEWVQLFPKDSWSNVTNEFEPFSFNEFGAKIPLSQFRATSCGTCDDAPTMPTLNVFMEVSGEGDFEVKYGNPNLVSDAKWVAVEFKSTLLRVGDPWADCTDDVLAANAYSVGSIMPVLFGGPNVNSIALAAGNPSYDDVIADLSGVTVPVKVVLEVFNAAKPPYTDSAEDGQCYKAGNACPENHHVCQASYCEMDVWKTIIAGLKSASTGMVTVLGSVDASTPTGAYADLNVDGFYDVPGAVAGARRLFGGEMIWASGGVDFEVTFAVDGDANPTLEVISGSFPGSWQTMESDSEQFSDRTYQFYDVPDHLLGLKFFQGPCHSNGASVKITTTGAMYVLVSTADHSASNMDSYVDMGGLEDSGFTVIDMNTQSFGSATGFYQYILGSPSGGSADRTISAGQVMVSAIGSPLFDDTLVDEADVYVTLASSDLGSWNPFSWYPTVSPSKWAAIVTDATSTAAIATLFDRGYGWVYLSDQTGFETRSTITTAVLDAIEATATGRRLAGRRLQSSAPYWGCDDTLLECKPVCLKDMGLTTSKVSDQLCEAETRITSEGAPISPCSCKCYHEAAWTCEGDAVVCKAKFGAEELRTVGDKVCEIRGAPKPVVSSRRLDETPSSGGPLCAPFTDMRGSTPTEECLAQSGPKSLRNQSS